MKSLGTWLTAAGLVFVVAGSASVLACGDKFLVPGGGLDEIRVPLAKVPATVLMYSPDPNSKEMLEASGMSELLGRAGHTADYASGADELDVALSIGHYDLILASYDVALELEDEVKTSGTEAVILPVLDPSQRSSLSEAKRDFGNVLNVPTSMGRVVKLIDKVLLALRQ